MDALNLNQTSVPASMFPERADEYVCDKCGRYITEHLHHGPGHAGIPLGPERYRCICGETYLSGAIEWDHLGTWERRRRIRMITMFWTWLPLPLLIFVTLAYLAFHHRSGLLLAACVLAFLPTFVLLLTSVVGLLEVAHIAASVWRTRVSGRLTSRDNVPE